MAEKQDNPIQGYFDWQVTTFMLAYDLVDPIPRSEEHRVDERRQAIEQEVSKMVMGIVPERYKQNPRLDWPPELMMSITRATLRRATQIAGM